MLAEVLCIDVGKHPARVALVFVQALVSLPVQILDSLFIGKNT